MDYGTAWPFLATSPACVWIEHEGRWIEGVLHSLGTSFLAVIVELPKYPRRLLQARPEEVQMRDPGAAWSRSAPGVNT